MSMRDFELEHPGVACALRGGYPQPRPTGLTCTVCQEEVGAEFFGECDGRIVCTDCAEQEWLELTPAEKLEKLGYNVEYNG